MAESEQVLTVEVPGEPSAPEQPTPEEMKDAGLSAREIEAAERHGMVAKPEKPEEKKKEEPKPEAKTGETPQEKAKETPKDESWIDEADLPEGWTGWSANERGLYRSTKKERVRRQRAELERDREAVKAKALEQELENLRKTSPAGKDGKEKPGAEDPLGDLFGDEAGADKKPRYLTREDLEAYEKEKQETAQKREAGRVEKATLLSAKLEEFEAEAQEKWEDFDRVAVLAKDILQNGAKLFEDADARELAEIRAQRALDGIRNALDWQTGQKTPAELVYELGRMHPKFKNKDAGENPARDGDDPEKAKRALENARRRSSAAVGGGNGSARLVAEDELTIEQAAKLSDAQFAKLRPETRRRLLGG